MQRSEWIDFLSGILQEDLRLMPDQTPLKDLMYWDSMARLVVMARLHEAGLHLKPAQIHSYATLADLVNAINPLNLPKDESTS